MDDTTKAREYAAVFDSDARAAERAVFAVGQPILNRAGLARVPYTQYGWFLRELSRLLRTRFGEELAGGLEASLVKWSGWGLDRKLLEQLVLECRRKATPDHECEADEGDCSGLRETGITAKTQSRKRVQKKEQTNHQARTRTAE